MSHRVGRSATIIPSVGCPIGCDFCTTSAFFGGKGKSVRFFDNGADLFEVMCQAEEKLRLTTFFMMDENFLLDRKRAMELLELMKANGKAWSLYVFASANAVAKYGLRELVELGISWVWLGLESPNSSYSKLNGADTRALTSKLRAHGIRVLGSTWASPGALRVCVPAPLHAPHPYAGPTGRRCRPAHGCPYRKPRRRRARASPLHRRGHDGGIGAVRPCGVAGSRETSGPPARNGGGGLRLRA